MVAALPLTETIVFTVSSTGAVGFSTVQAEQAPTEAVTTLVILVTLVDSGLTTLTVYVLVTVAPGPTDTVWVQAEPATAPEAHDQPSPVPK